MIYEPSVLQSPPTFPGFLASSLPYQAEPIPTVGDNLHPFFINLLPEGARLAALVERRRTAKGDFLSMLMDVGFDTVGDVAVVREGVGPVKRAARVDPGSIRFSEVLDRELSEGRSSVPGVQDKISEATISLFVSMRSSAVILKLSPPGLPNLVENEAFFMKMAADCGLEVAKTQVVYDMDNVAGLMVARFDRRGKKPVQKFHQEDGCQLLNVIPANKYSVDFPQVNLRAILKAGARHVTSLSDTVRRMLTQYAFSYLIGNADMHAKNLSIYWHDGIVSLTPGYDILSTLPYPKHDRHMALALDGKDDDFRARDIIRFAATFNVPETAIRDSLRKMTEGAAAWITRLNEIGFDQETTEKLAREIEERRQRLIP